MKKPPYASEPARGGFLTGADNLPDEDQLAPVYYLDERFKPAEVLPFRRRYDTDGLLRLWRAVAMEPYGGDAA